MELATVREAVNLTNNTKAISPYTLRQVLESYSTIELVKQLIAEAQFDPSTIDLSAYAKKTDIPTKLSQLDNDDNYVQTIDGIIPAQYLPSYVDDVLEYSSSSKFPNPGDSGKIYVDTTTNLTYRWGGSGYVEISKSLALGTTSTTAFRGDHGLAAYQHISVTGNPHSLTLGDLSITVDAETINYLSGLSENILTALYKKLNTAGGTLSGYLTLHHDPVEKMHATTKQYVDNMIDGISVTVTQNVTRITEIAGDLESQKKLIGVQADTLTEVKNDITGLNQTTDNHTEAISELTQDVEGLTSTVSKTSESVTTLEATINLISLELAQDVIVIPVDKDNKPVNTAEYKIKYTVRFRGNIVKPEEMSITGGTDGIVVTKDDEYIIVNVDSTKTITSQSTGYTIKVGYTQSVLYEDGKVLAIVLVPKGADGAQGKDGEPGKTGEDGKTLYTWIKYADSPTSGMSDNPSGKLYMGIAYNKETEVESENYEDYSWSLVKGEDGQPGKDGQDGAPGKDGEQGERGPQGEQGIPGVGIVSIVEQYYLSTDPSTPTGGNWSPDYPGWANGNYIWTKTIFTYSDGSTKETDPICVTGAQGQTGMTGAAGTSITNVDVLYYQSDKPDDLVGGNWDTTVPVWNNNKYLWTKTRVHYTDAQATSWSEETNPVCVTGSKGSTGDKGDKGDTGEQGISFSHIINWYAFGDDQENEPEDGWNTLLTTRPNGKYLWIKEEIFLSDGSSVWGTPYPVTGDKGDQGPRGLQGLQGEKGEQGIQGPKGDTGEKGATGATTYFHIKYSAVSNPTTSSQMTETPNVYIGTYVDTTQADSTDPSKYTWARFQGLQGETGEQGIPGKDGTSGTDGKTSYLHIKYSNDGGQTFTSNNGETVGDYIGQYVDYTESDSTSPTKYKWSKIKGETGAQGPKGDTGEKGETGSQGPKGDTGAQGPQGSTGAKGDKGDKGDTGSQGPKGDTGSTGPQGPQGPAGEDAAVQGYDPPTNTSQLWLDLNTNQLKQYVTHSDGTASWVVINDYSEATDAINKSIADLNNQLAEDLAELNNLITTIRSESSTSIEQTNEDITIKFNQVQENITKTLDELHVHVSDQSQYIRFELGTITLGESDSDYTLTVDNDMITIYYKGAVISQWNKSKFIASEVGIKEQSWDYRFAWVTNPNGSVSFRKVSDE